MIIPQIRIHGLSFEQRLPIELFILALWGLGPVYQIYKSDITSNGRKDEEKRRYFWPECSENSEIPMLPTLVTYASELLYLTTCILYDRCSFVGKLPSSSSSYVQHPKDIWKWNYISSAWRFPTMKLAWLVYSVSSSFEKSSSVF